MQSVWLWFSVYSCCPLRASITAICCPHPFSLFCHFWFIYTRIYYYHRLLVQLDSLWFIIVLREHTLLGQPVQSSILRVSWTFSCIPGLSSVRCHQLAGAICVLVDWLVASSSVLTQAQAEQVNIFVRAHSCTIRCSSILFSLCLLFIRPFTSLAYIGCLFSACPSWIVVVVLFGRGGGSVNCPIATRQLCGSHPLDDNRRMCKHPLGPQLSWIAAGRASPIACHCLLLANNLSVLANAHIFSWSCLESFGF